MGLRRHPAHGPEGDVLVEHIEGLCWSLVFLIVAAAAFARMLGWRELEAFAVRAAVAVVLVLFALPLVRHEASAIREGAASRASGCAMPGVVVVHPEHLVGGALVIAGHLAMGLWLLRRRARGDEQRRAQQQDEADRRRERGRLPPRDLDGGA